MMNILIRNLIASQTRRFYRLIVSIPRDLRVLSRCRLDSPNEIYEAERSEKIWEQCDSKSVYLICRDFELLVFFLIFERFSHTSLYIFFDHRFI